MWSLTNGFCLSQVVQILQCATQISSRTSILITSASGSNGCWGWLLGPSLEIAFGWKSCLTQVYPLFSGRSPHLKTGYQNYQSSFPLLQSGTSLSDQSKSSLWDRLMTLLQLCEFQSCFFYPPAGVAPRNIP